MAKLFLFDIDGTLTAGSHDKTLSAGFTEDRFILAIRNALGVEARRDRDVRGLTDYLILKEMLIDVGWDEQRIQSAIPKLIAELNKIHEERFRADLIRVLPGVKELLAALAERGQILGLVTGNLEMFAKLKLEALDIWSFFSVGGFGSDPHTNRADLVELAIKRAGFQDRLRDVYLIGDTSKDIEAARDAGVENSVGVVNGFRDPRELIDAGAKIVLDDFTDTRQVLKSFGVATR